VGQAAGKPRRPTIDVVLKMVGQPLVAFLQEAYQIGRRVAALVCGGGMVVLGLPNVVPLMLIVLLAGWCVQNFTSVVLPKGVPPDNVPSIV
jgi:hypothetical protein